MEARFFDAALSGSIFVSKTDFEAVLGTGSIDWEGIAFAPGAGDPIPEPSTLFLVAAGVAFVATRRRRRSA
ncbi:MAG: PEP-CTERM sorting domain-containing protein [Planctomycetota bacterium]|nr:PEP-CTERM sorting domain-containing protein [Planctomycetota bacterium]